MAVVLLIQEWCVCGPLVTYAAVMKVMVMGHGMAAGGSLCLPSCLARDNGADKSRDNGSNVDNYFITVTNINEWRLT